MTKLELPIGANWFQEFATLVDWDLADSSAWSWFVDSSDTGFVIFAPRRDIELTISRNKVLSNTFNVRIHIKLKRYDGTWGYFKNLGDVKPNEAFAKVKYCLDYFLKLLERDGA